jgi:sialic acid synthase SpsE
MNLKIGNITLGDDAPVLVIPEGCDNHHGSLNQAKELASAAKEAGARIIKFQLHLPDEEMDREGMAITSSKMFKQWGDLYGFIEKNLLSVEDHAKLIAFCKKIDIQYFCTPFSAKAAHILKEIGGDEAYKIGSGETDDLPMIEEVAKLGKPMIISTGMTTLEEIDMTVETVKKYNTPLSLMHCISSYPPQSENDLHLGVIAELKRRYDILLGFSDHTPPQGITSVTGELISEEQIVWSAIAQGARYIEKHFTLDRNASDADSRFSHDGKTLKRLINSVETAGRALDAKKEIYDCERDVLIWAKRSLFARVDMAKGTTIERSMLISKRPGTGIRSKEYSKIIGKKIKNEVKKNKMLKLNGFE